MRPLELVDWDILSVESFPELVLGERNRDSERRLLAERSLGVRFDPDLVLDELVLLLDELD